MRIELTGIGPNAPNNDADRDDDVWIPNDPTITSAKLAAQIPGSVLVDSLEAAADWVKQNAREGDLVITLGCGDIYKASRMMVADNNK